MAVDWGDLWALDPDVHFLNHGSFGACPVRVLEHQQALREQLEWQPVQFLARRLPELLDEARTFVAEFVNCDPADLVFVRNATEGVNAVLRSVPLHPGDELIVTNHAYGACRNTLDFVAGRSGAEVVVAKIPFPIEFPGQIIEAVLACVSARTRLVFVDHVTSVTALVMPIEELLRSLEGIDVLVDGAHAPGMVEVDLKKLAPAYYAANCHKWLCSPKGAGFLYVRPDRQDQVRPTSISHGATQHGDRSRFLAEFDWTGTDDPTAVLAVPEAIRYVGSLLPGGWAELMDRNQILARQARRRICEALSIELPAPDELIGSIASIAAPDASPTALRSAFHADPLQMQLLEGYAIEIPIETWPEPPKRLMRLSAQLYNRLEEYELLAEALAEII